MCWPTTGVNETIYLPCANYVNKFNIDGNQSFIETMKE